MPDKSDRHLRHPRTPAQRMEKRRPRQVLPSHQASRLNAPRCRRRRLAQEAGKGLSDTRQRILRQRMLNDSRRA